METYIITPNIQRVIKNSKVKIPQANRKWTKGINRFSSVLLLVNKCRKINSFLIANPTQKQ